MDKAKAAYCSAASSAKKCDERTCEWNDATRRCGLATCEDFTTGKTCKKADHCAWDGTACADLVCGSIGSRKRCSLNKTNGACYWAPGSIEWVQGNKWDG